MNIGIHQLPQDYFSYIGNKKKKKKKKNQKKLTKYQNINTQKMLNIK
ncbi:hypothetical protein SSAG_01838 [Streptomyces sp. Mg1]|nr:hypothetical protein SSAG_01838 [Streptomyces sp. Mg1]